MTDKQLLEFKHLTLMEQLISKHLELEPKFGEVILDLTKYYATAPGAAVDDPTVLCMRSGYIMASDLYGSSMRSVTQGYLIGGGGNARTLIEIAADMYHIYHNPKKLKERAKKYTDSVGTYGDTVRTAADASEKGESIRLKNANPWSTSTIDDRVHALGNSVVNMYDFFSCCAHANPMTIVMLQSKVLKQTLRLMILGAAMQTMLTLSQIAVRDNNVPGITMDELDLLGEELLKITPTDI